MKSEIVQLSLWRFERGFSELFCSSSSMRQNHDLDLGGNIGPCEGKGGHTSAPWRTCGKRKGRGDLKRIKLTTIKWPQMGVPLFGRPQSMLQMRPSHGVGTWSHPAYLRRFERACQVCGLPGFRWTSWFLYHRINFDFLSRPNATPTTSLLSPILKYIPDRYEINLPAVGTGLQHDWIQNAIFPYDVKNSPVQRWFRHNDHPIAWKSRENNQYQLLAYLNDGTIWDMPRTAHKLAQITYLQDNRELIRFLLSRSIRFFCLAFFPEFLTGLQCDTSCWLIHVCFRTTLYLYQITWDCGGALISKTRQRIAQRVIQQDISSNIDSDLRSTQSWCRFSRINFQSSVSMSQLINAISTLRRTLNHFPSLDVDTYSSCVTLQFPLT